MLISSNLLPIIIAGLINGSFVIPARFVKGFSNERVWLIHCVIGFIIIPWIILALTSSNFLLNYYILPTNLWVFLLISGFVFGLGQVCFSSAIQKIGIALSFTINLGIGVTIGSLFVVFYRTNLLNLQSYLVILAVFLIVLSLIIYYFAGKYTPYTINHKQQTLHYRLGWVLASMTGFASGLQNIAFVIVAFHNQTHINAQDSFWVWPPFLFTAAIPMFIGLWYKKRNTLITQKTTNLQIVKNILLITLMGIFFTGSLALYSRSMSHLASQQQIGWPIFMVLIILTSQTWGWIFKETGHLTPKTKIYKLFSVILLLVAIILLSVISTK